MNNSHLAQSTLVCEQFGKPTTDTSASLQRVHVDPHLLKGVLWIRVRLRRVLQLLQRLLQVRFLPSRFHVLVLRPHFLVALSGFLRPRGLLPPLTSGWTLRTCHLTVCCLSCPRFCVQLLWPWIRCGSLQFLRACLVWWIQFLRADWVWGLQQLWRLLRGLLWVRVELRAPGLDFRSRYSACPIAFSFATLSWLPSSLPRAL